MTDFTSSEDWVTVARYTDPTLALVIQGCLQAAGVPATVADQHMVQMHSLLAGAIPVRVQVPASWEHQALRVLAAFERGDFALPEDYGETLGESDIGSGDDEPPQEARDAIYR